MFKFNLKRLFYLILQFFTFVFIISANEGYITYCPCMGRFGNQADQFLGALAFAKGLNRTLILPPWVEYRYGQPKSIQVPFNTYFKVEPLLKYHKVITMEKFMAELADVIWPPEKRISFCYGPRGANKSTDCNSKEGNPFGPFWDTFNVDFVGSEFFEPLHFDIHYNHGKEKWSQKYPIDKYPVLAFTGAPGSFPVQLENRKLQKYLEWNDNITEIALNFIKNKLPKGAFIGLHLRNGIDWVRACEHVTQSPNLFAAPQCLGYRNEHGKATQEICLPSRDIIIRQLKRTLKKYKSSEYKVVKSIFVASDNYYMLEELNAQLQRFNVTAHRFDLEIDFSLPHLELAILAKSNHFIGNCISSFSAFVKRERDVFNLPSTFWAFPVEKYKLKNNSGTMHDEL